MFYWISVSKANEQMETSVRSNEANVSYECLQNRNNYKIVKNKTNYGMFPACPHGLYDS